MRLRKAHIRGILAATVVALTLVGTTGCFGRYEAVTHASPAFSSSAHGFTIQFPGKPSVKTFDNGDIDVSFRTGVSDYSVIAGTLQSVPEASQLPTAYKAVIGRINGTNGAKATDIGPTTIDGVAAEHSLMVCGRVRQPWNYSIVICGPNIYQFNTYGVKSADVAKFLATMHIAGKSQNGCG